MEAVGRLGAAIIIAASLLLGLLRGCDVFDAMTAGAAEGLRVVARIFPPLLCLLTAVGMLRASGLIEALTALLSPLLSAAGIPPETAVLMLLRPISGSGALAAAAELIRSAGPDSAVGRTAAVMLGSTETTFYVTAVYFGAAGIRKTRWAIPAAICADVAGFFFAALFTRTLLG